MKFDILTKIKNMSMRTKRIIALVICVSLLAIAIVQNVKTDKGEAGGKTNGDNVNVSIGDKNKEDSENVNGENNPENVGQGVLKVNSTEEYFATIRLNRLNSRSETEESCNDIIDSESASESTVADAVATMESLKKTTKMETDLETAIKARGYDDVFVIIENDCVYITVQSNSLDGNEVSTIAAAACDSTGYNLDDIILKGVY